MLKWARIKVLEREGGDPDIGSLDWEPAEYHRGSQAQMGKAYDMIISSVLILHNAAS